MGPSSLQVGNEQSGVQAIGFAAMAGFVYAFNSRVLDLHFYYLHLPLVLGATTGICAVVAGSLFKAFRTRVGILYVCLTCWFMAGVPFSYWRGGSVGILKSWFRSLVIWAFLVGLTVTYRECKLLLNTFVVAAATAALMALTGGGREVEGRLSLEQGLLANPNYLALVLLVALPFAWRFFSGGGRPGMFRRWLAGGMGGLILVAFFKSGSRAGLYSLGVMVILTILRANLMRKVQIALVAGVLFVSIFAALPRYLRDRYFTFSSTEGVEYEDYSAAKIAGSAAGSTLQRQHLFRESMSITLTHPIFGVGLGNFSGYVWRLNKDAGRKMERWLGTHNSYTQMSSEGGVPAILIFFGIISVTWRSLTRLIRATRHDDRPRARDIHIAAHSAQVCLGSFCFFLFFIHMAYEVLPHMLMGMVLAVALTAERELKDLDAQQLPPVAGNFAGDREILFSGGYPAPQVSRIAGRGAAALRMTAEGRPTAQAGSPRPF